MNNFVYNDGGRADAGYQGRAGDCVVRAIAIASELPYQVVYDGVMNAQRSLLKKAGVKGSCSPRNGVRTSEIWFHDYMRSLGWKWKATMGIGTGCKVHLLAKELPMGKIIASVSKHYVAVIDGIINDTEDCSRGGTRCVYGYWHK